MQTELTADLDAAVRLLAAGEIVALPTETVYGLAGDALDPRACAKIFEAKERPSFDPLICHLPDFKWLNRMAEIPSRDRPLVMELIERFWPGPLTLVLPRREIVPDIVTSGLSTVAVRMSAQPQFAQIARTLDRPLAAPSANIFGRISPTTAAHVLADLGGRIPLVIDGGPTAHGLESTIVSVDYNAVNILRHGPVTFEDLRQHAVVFEQTSDKITAPGQLASHYAPRTPMTFDIPASGSRSGYLAFRDVPRGEWAAIEVLSPTGDLREAAATLFAKLRHLDSLHLRQIVAETMSDQGLGAAIMDRLRRAAARPENEG